MLKMKEKFKKILLNLFLFFWFMHICSMQCVPNSWHLRVVFTIYEGKLKCFVGKKVSMKLHKAPHHHVYKILYVFFKWVVMKIRKCCAVIPWFLFWEKNFFFQFCSNLYLAFLSPHISTYLVLASNCGILFLWKKVQYWLWVFKSVVSYS